MSISKAAMWEAKEAGSAVRKRLNKHWKGAINISWLQIKQTEAKILVTSSTPTSGSNPLPYPSPSVPRLSGKFSPESVQLRYCLGKADLQNRMGLAQLFHRKENNLLFEPMILLLTPPLDTEDKSLHINIQVRYAFLSETSLINFCFK